jgi:lipopolysaccharide/colanic/teichoic acid biosynthesis glycosyltransferase
MYSTFFKRIGDIIASSILLIFLLPLMIIITILILLVNKGNPLFFQKRPGKDENIFRLLKFKTMNDEKDIFGELLPSNARVTILGRVLRNYSLDELPQLINVLKGDMSLIGPRPLVPHYLSLYNKTQKRRHNVRPGITGWAQVNGRNAISWSKKFEYDIWYVDHISFWTDLKIFFKTVLKVIKREGISSGGPHTMPIFTGN